MGCKKKIPGTEWEEHLAALKRSRAAKIGGIARRKQLPYSPPVSKFPELNTSKEKSLKV